MRRYKQQKSDCSALLLKMFLNRNVYIYTLYANGQNENKSVCWVLNAHNLKLIQQQVQLAGSFPVLDLMKLIIINTIY